jgi:PAS domain S-box-containing protein
VASYNYNDIQHRWCPVCKIFHDTMIAQWEGITALDMFKQPCIVPQVLTAVEEPHVIVEVNKCFEDVTGYTRDEVVGRSIYDLNLWVHPEHRIAMVERLKRGGEPQLLEVEFRMKDGTIRHFVGTMGMTGGKILVQGAAVDTDHLAHLKDKLAG